MGGPLAVCPGSHRLLDDESTCSSQAAERKAEDELPAGFDAFRRKHGWRSTHFRKGDVLLFDIRTVHASLLNTTQRFRCSIDTRWQPKQQIAFWSDSLIRFEQFANAQHAEDMDESS